MSAAEIGRRALLASGAALLTAARYTGEKRSGIHRFLGIRYARARRFMPPVAEPFQSQARAGFGPSCS